MNKYVALKLLLFFHSSPWVARSLGEHPARTVTPLSFSLVPSLVENLEQPVKVVEDILGQPWALLPSGASSIA